jgi:heterodisulfide reductase subunit A
VHLIERSDALGGHLRRLRYLANPQTGTLEGAPDPQAYLADLIQRTQQHPLITVHLNTELEATTGFKGNFTSILHRDGQSFEIQHGVTIVATGAVEYRGNSYGYGTDPRIMTQQELEELLSRWEPGQLVAQDSIGQPTHQSTSLPNTVVMIQCAAPPSEKYCSRICCAQALKNALKLKELNPRAQITVLYRDLRVYGFGERLYTEARRRGVLFVRYDFDRKPEVSVDGRLTVQAYEPHLGRGLTWQPDLLVLSMPVVPPEGARELGTRLKVPVDLDGFFLEAHVKLRPVDFASDGIYMAGMAHYPKLLDEAIVQAQAAAARAALVLARDTIIPSPIVAQVTPEKCVGCLTCVRFCPYQVPRIDPALIGAGGIAGAAYINPAVCHGCGICAAECPARAIQLVHYTNEQIESKVDALFELVGLESVRV